MMNSLGRKSLLKGTNEPVDPRNLSDLEKRHLPVIDAPDRVERGKCFEATVEVGRLLAHPAEHQHFIQYLELYADDTFLARVDWAAARSCPKVTFHVALEIPAEELRANAHCNMHGTWLGRKAVTVVEAGSCQPT